MITRDAEVEPKVGWQRLQTVTQSIIVSSLILYAFFAPHSIAVTQAGFLLGMVAWGVEIIASRKYRQPRTPIDIAVFGFFACCVISSFFSYELLTSLKGLKSPAFFLAFYFVLNNIKNLRMARLLAVAIVASCLINVLYSAGQIAVGRGIKITSIKPGSAFAGEGFQIGDVITHADDRKINTPEELSNLADESRGKIPIVFQRNEAVLTASVSRRAIRRSGEEGVARLGITTAPGRSFRVSGFYSHYETYAEVLQLIAAFAFGLFIALPKKTAPKAWLLGGTLLLMTLMLIMTSTRAAIAGLAMGALVIALASYHRRRALLLLVGAMLLFAPITYQIIKSARGDILFNLREESTTYRLEVWREAFSLIRDHPLAGIGKGSEGGALLREKYALYNNGKLPPGHFHSSYIQIAAWWGLPALAFYFSMMTIFFLEMWKLSRRLRREQAWQEWGIVLGGIGTLVAFNISSIVHFNFGDGEVVMVFWLITGIVFAVRHLSLQEVAARATTSNLSLPEAEGSDKNRLREPEVASESSVRAAAAGQHSPPPR